MLARCRTVAFSGVEARPVEVQCALSHGSPAFTLVGLPDKSVSEARERVRAALQSMAIALPSRRITINLSPADLPKIGTHFDLPIALSLLAALGILPPSDLDDILAFGELALDGHLVPVAGALPAALAAAEADCRLVCAAASGPEAAWVEGAQIIASPGLAEILRHLSGQQILHAPRPGRVEDPAMDQTDLAQVRGQERARRALEIAAAGRHHLLLVGPPGAGKSLLASCLPGLLPPLTPAEALETSMIHSLAGQLPAGRLSRRPPYRAPHHGASMAALTGGGRTATPGEISMAHNGVLFLDELPEFRRDALETLRQPLESGQITVARANAHVTYPSRVLLIAAANPCRCGHLTDPARACSRAPICGEDYMGRISGPLLDRFDLRVDVPPVTFGQLEAPQPAESTAQVAARVQAARVRQQARSPDAGGARVNADLQGAALEAHATPDAEGRALMAQVADRMGLSARGYHRVLRVARTIADLAGEDRILRPHLAEAVTYRPSGMGPV